MVAALHQARRRSECIDRPCCCAASDLPVTESNRKFQRISRSRKAHKTAQDVESEDEDDGSYTLSTEELVNLLQERFGHL